jgi:hypothetical protein
MSHSRLAVAAICLGAPLSLIAAACEGEVGPSNQLVVSGHAGAGGSGEPIVSGPGTTGSAGTGMAGKGVAGMAGTVGMMGMAGMGMTAGAGGSAPTPPPVPPTTDPPPVTQPPPATAAGTIVPLYTSPSHASWTAVVAGKMAHPTVDIIAVVNPSNGPGGAPLQGYVDGIARLAVSGVRVAGYVFTDYTKRTVADAKADIALWKTFYSQVKGIFFDEQSNSASHVEYYRELAQYAKSMGFGYTIGNPGADTAKEYVGVLDTMLIYESGGLPAISRLGGWHADHAPANFGVIPYAAAFDATFVREARKLVRYVYLQNDDLPNPWDTLPPYFNDLLTALE